MDRQCDLPLAISHLSYRFQVRTFKFKSDVAKAVINTYYNDAEVVSTTKRLVFVWIHKSAIFGACKKKLAAL
eukprot:scaffold6177_cov122-Skeletonema_dohrnii-CCMP3373.AAC.2